VWTGTSLSSTATSQSFKAELRRVFWAKGSASQPISIGLQKQVANWDNYGLWQQVTLTPQWTKVQLTFEASVSAADGELGFSIGAVVGPCGWTACNITEHPADVFHAGIHKRSGVLNGTRDRQTVSVGSVSRAFPAHKPAHLPIVDDPVPHQQHRPLAEL